MTDWNKVFGTMAGDDSQSDDVKVYTADDMMCLVDAAIALYEDGDKNGILARLCGIRTSIANGTFDIDKLEDISGCSIRHNHVHDVKLSDYQLTILEDVDYLAYTDYTHGCKEERTYTAVAEIQEKYPTPITHWAVYSRPRGDWYKYEMYTNPTCESVLSKGQGWVSVYDGDAMILVYFVDGRFASGVHLYPSAIDVLYEQYESNVSWIVGDNKLNDYKNSKIRCSRDSNDTYHLFIDDSEVMPLSREAFNHIHDKVESNEIAPLHFLETVQFNLVCG